MGRGDRVTEAAAIGHVREKNQQEVEKRSTKKLEKREGASQNCWEWRKEDALSHETCIIGDLCAVLYQEQLNKETQTGRHLVNHMGKCWGRA